MDLQSVIPSKNSWLQKIKWRYVVVYSVLFCSLIPKIIISEGVNIFFPEVIITIGLILGMRQLITFQEQQLMLGMFLSIMIFSFVAQYSTNDIGAIMRSFKEILYIPIIYWASLIKEKKQILKHIVIYGCIAYCFNILLYIQGYAAENTIWSGAESLSSGMSNRGFKLPSLSIVQLPGLAHGIWGSYCVLVFVITLSTVREKIISKPLFLVSIALFIVNMLITISRESILLLSVIAILSFFRSGLSITKRIVIIAALIIAVLAIATWGGDLPVIQKITYTYTSLTETKSEGNLTLRMNTWAAYLNFIIHNQEYLIAGLGLSPDNFYNHISLFTNADIVDVPESVIVYMQAFGGIVSFALFIMLVVTTSIRLNKRSPYKLLKYFFIGILITNSISSVSMFSDLLYAHICLIYGLLIVRSDEN